MITCLALGYLGSKPPEGGYLIAARIATAYYFLHFLVVMPFVGIVETPKPQPRSIADSVLGPSAHGGGRAPQPAPAAADPR